MRGYLVSTVFALVLGAAAPALAANCGASAPAPGSSFSGPVLDVVDGDTLCVAFGPTPAQWVQVRLTDLPAHVDRRALMSATFAKRIDCVTLSSAVQGVNAVCTLAGAGVGNLVRTAAAGPDYKIWR